MAITAAKALSMIEAWGMTGTIETLASESMASDGSLTEGTATENTVYMSPPIDQSTYSTSSLKEVNDSATFVSPSGLSFTIVKGLKLTFGSEQWTINEVKQFYANEGNVAVYELGLVI